MTLPAIDYTSLTDAEVSELKMQAILEEERRYRIALAPMQAEAISIEYFKDTGQNEGSEWVQPTGAHDAYPLNYTVVQGGKTWKSKIPANVWAPGLDPRWWEDLTPVVEPPIGETPAWDGNAKAYAVNDEVTYEGFTYKCLQAHTSQAGWTPVVVPALWQKL